MREEAPPVHSEQLSGVDKLLAKSIDELDLSVRSANCLKNANFHTLRDLVRKGEREMLETKNFGKKSLVELQEVLATLGLQFGTHQRVSFPNPSLLGLEDVPEDEWNADQLISGIWTIFPHISIADFDVGGKIYMVSQLFPGATADDSLTVQNFLVPDEPDEERQKQIETMMGFLEHVVRDEDYYTGNRIQRALKTGAKSELLFGRNEGGGQRFHRWLEALVHTDDADLPALFEKGVGV